MNVQMPIMTPEARRFYPQRTRRHIGDNDDAANILPRPIVVSKSWFLSWPKHSGYRSRALFAWARPVHTFMSHLSECRLCDNIVDLNYMCNCSTSTKRTRSVYRLVHSRFANHAIVKTCLRQDSTTLSMTVSLHHHRVSLHIQLSNPVLSPANSNLRLLPFGLRNIV
ncbi:hypothetical protein T440DRAFT_179856 [Plenodomus tracheiphilus IPT5]|uniref:Uncharacterized protein n=1 Tax=Plenodomus tracheiphilus IPT5 TaxID=1408161 RepID=A0A6A7AXI9_9PLEO|nr:hypothetical protein T440DRAFT_179856 [Plenodomus tracheiphilus IPT5]